MKKNLFLLLCLCLFGVAGAGCGYTTRSVIAGGIKTIYIAPFKNKISFNSDSQRNIYLPLLEVKVTDAIIDRFLFDGNLKIVSEDKADAILTGEFINYERQVLRYNEDNDAQEYRINITVSLVFKNTKTDTIIWQEPNFVGETTYFTEGSLAVSEDTALKEALTDLGRRVVERTIEDW